MIQLKQSMAAWGTPRFKSVLKDEIEHLSVAQLPLQQGLSQTSTALEGDMEVMILNIAEEGDTIRAKAGVFYNGIIAGCACIDDPTPVEEQPEYSELLFEIDKSTADARVSLT